MNARIPLYSRPTAYPATDAAHWSDEQEAADDAGQEAERQAPLIILAKLQAITQPGDWFSKNLLSAGRGWAPDEVLHDTVAIDDDTLNAYVELLTNLQTLKLRQCMAAWFGSKLARDIFQEHMESLQ